MGGRFWPVAGPAAATSSPSATKELFATPKPANSAAYSTDRVARSFPKSSRILRPAEFHKVYDHGVRLTNPLFAAFCLKRTLEPCHETPTDESNSRLGLTVPKAVGKAVERNRIRRCLREAFRLHQHEFAGPWDVVVNPRRKVLSAPFTDVERALQGTIEQ